MNKEEFFQSFGMLEAHMNVELIVSNNTEYVGRCECACGKADKYDKSFTVECSLMGSSVTLERTEHALFMLNNQGT